MKLKELPASLYQTFRLRALPASALKRPGTQVPVIVSMTSIGPRLKGADLPVRSLLSQPTKPEKILLWLHESLKGKIPKRLAELEGEIFSISFASWDSPHLKLVRTLETHPGKVVVTVDDDLIYQSGWLEKLYREHQERPGHIIANQVRRIRYDGQGAPLSYSGWPTTYEPCLEGPEILPIGSAGALYPPGSLDDRFGEVELFLKLAPRADDLWFKAMSLLKGTPSAMACERPGPPIPILGSQAVSLKKQNIGQDKNREQWIALQDYFDLPALPPPSGV